MRSLRSFLLEPRPSLALASAGLRSVFVAMFLAQMLVALLLLLLLSVLVGVQSGGPALLGVVLILLGAAQLPFAYAMSLLAVRSGGKQAALYGTLLAAVLLSTPAWYAAFALLIGQRTAALVLLALLASGYALGFVLSGRFARRAAAP